MAEFDYFGTWRDSWTVLSAVMALDGMRAVTNRDYPEPAATLFDAADNRLHEAARSAPKVYLFGPYSKYGPIFWRQDMGPKAGRYYIAHNKGGPFLTLLLACETDSGLIGLGNLSYGREYLDPISGEWNKPSPELKAAFETVRAEMKRHLQRHQLKQKIWIGRDALEKLQRGELRITAAGVV